MKTLRSELSTVKKKLKAAESNFAKRLKQARMELDDSAAKELVLQILRAGLDTILDRYVIQHRRQVVAAFENWWDKYRVTLTSIEQERGATAAKLRELLGELRYA